MAKNHMKKCSSTLTKKEMKIKTTLRCYPTPVRTATIKHKQEILARMGEKGTFIH
jgi:hypothetical protein